MATITIRASSWILFDLLHEGWIVISYVYRGRLLYVTLKK